MYFANPWGLAALAAIPVIIVIHLYHRRFPPLMVAGLHLWSSETRQTMAGRRREKLPVTASLLLELLAALLLAIVLSEPHFSGMNEAVHLVAVLDGSASMSAKPPGTGEISFRDAAVAELEQRAARLPRGSVVTLILSGRRPVMLAGPAIPWADAKPKLADWQPRAPRHSFEPAWDLGLQLVEHSGRLLFLTDHLPPDSAPHAGGAAMPQSVGRGFVPDRMEWVSVGRRLDNLAISAARWTFDAESGKGKIFIRVQSHSRQPANFELVGLSGEKIVFRRSSTLAERGALSFEADVPGGLGKLTIELSSTNDGLPADNRIELIEPQARIVTAAIELASAESARAVRRVLEAIPEVQFGESGAAHLVFAAAGSLPESNPGRWWVGFGPISKDKAAIDAAKDLAGPYLIDKRQPLVDGILLSGVVWGGVQPVPYDGTPIVSSGQSPLIARLNGTRAVAYLFNIDLERSNLPESPDWPILLANLVELRRENLPGLARWNYRLGEEVRFRLYEGDGDASASSTPLSLNHAGKSKPIARTSLVELPPLDETGVYELKDSEQLIGRFAVNFFDGEESDLRNLTPGRREAQTIATAAATTIDNPYSWAVLALLLVIVAAVFSDWFVLKRP